MVATDGGELDAGMAALPLTHEPDVCTPVVVDRFEALERVADIFRTGRSVMAAITGGDDLERLSVAFLLGLAVALDGSFTRVRPRTYVVGFPA